MLRNFGRVLRFAAHKESTFIPGYPVVTNAREVLSALYRKTLDEVKTLPDTAVYRQTVESYTKYRLSVVEGNEDVKRIENLIKAGQVEELIEQAEEELEVIDLMREEKPWETEPGHKVGLYVTGRDEENLEDPVLRASGKGHSIEDLETCFGLVNADGTINAAAAAPPAADANKPK